MKYFSVLLLILIFFSFCNNANKPITHNREEQWILCDSVCTTKDVSEGCESIRIYNSSQNAFSFKISSEIFGETGNVESVFYIESNELKKIETSLTKYDKPYTEKERELVKSTVLIYLFRDGRLVSYKENNNDLTNSFSVKATEDSLLSVYNDYYKRYVLAFAIFKFDLKKWYGIYDADIKNDNDSTMFEASINIHFLTKDNCVISKVGRESYFSDICFYDKKNDTLILYHKNNIEGHSPLKKYEDEGKLYFNSDSTITFLSPYVSKKVVMKKAAH